jgi:hypothetical protein
VNKKVEELKRKLRRVQEELNEQKEIFQLENEICLAKLELEDRRQKQMEERRESPELSISLPSAGTRWERGRRARITWAYAGPIGEFIRVDLLKRGFLFREILLRGSIELRELDWVVPRELFPGSDYQVRLIARETGLEARSDLFEIF